MLEKRLFHACFQTTLQRVFKFRGRREQSNEQMVYLQQVRPLFGISPCYYCLCSLSLSPLTLRSTCFIGNFFPLLLLLSYHQKENKLSWEASLKKVSHSTDARLDKIQIFILNPNLKAIFGTKDHKDRI